MTFKFLLKNPDRQLELLNNQPVCDVLFVGSDHVVACHSAVLKDMSLVFAQMFSGKYEESRECKIPVDAGIPRGVIAAAVDYFYTGALTVKGNQAMDLLRFAHKYQLDDVCDACNKVLLPLVTLENAETFLPLARQFGSSRLAEKCRMLLLGDQVEREKPLLPLNPIFLESGPAAVLVYLSKRKLKIQTEQDVFDAIIAWFKLDKEKRGKFLGNIIDTCMSAVDLDVIKVRETVKKMHVSADHPLSKFAASLPVKTLTQLPVPRSDTTMVDCIICHASSDSKLSEFTFYLNDSARVVLGPQRKNVYENIDEIAHIRGNVFAKSDDVNIEQWMVHSNSAKVKETPLCSDYVFELDCIQDALLAISNKRDKLELTVALAEPGLDVKVLKSKTVSIPPPEEECMFYMFVTWERFLFALQPDGDVIIVYDVMTFKQLGAPYFNFGEPPYFACAQRLNVCVLVGLEECCMILLNKIVRVRGGNAVLSEYPSALRFEVPEDVTREHQWDKSAEILGNRLVIIQAEQTSKTFRIFTTDLNPIIANSHDPVWTEEVVDVKILMLRSMTKLQWLDAQRIRKTRAEFDNFAPYDVESDDAESEGDLEVVRDGANDGYVDYNKDEYFEDDEKKMDEDSDDSDELPFLPRDEHNAEFYFNRLKAKVLFH